MQSKLSFICDRVIEAGWLAALVFAPLYFNVYSSRVFEPDKIGIVRDIVLMMTVAWFIKLIEGYLGRRSSGYRSTGAAVADAAPGWLPRLLRVPMMLPIILYAGMYLFSTLASIVPLTSFFGSYQRMQGLISQYTYIMLALMILANMRSRAQLQRMITFGIATSLPVAAYGLLQATGHDPLPWAGDVQTRVASTLGNAIFVAAYLIMAVPLTLSRLVAAVADRRALTAGTPPEPAAPADPRDDPWPLAIIGSAAIFLLMLIQYLGMTTGNRIEVPGIPGLNQDYNMLGDVLIWVGILAAGAGFVWLANNVADQYARPLGRQAAEAAGGAPAWAAVLTPIAQLAVLGLALYIVGSVRAADFSLWIVLPVGIFIFYALTFLYTMGGRPTVAANTLQLVALPILILMQIVVTFLTQSRGPELGLLVGLAVFVFAFVLRRRLYRAFAVSLAATLLFGGFLVIFNLPNSPIASWRTLPYIGRLGLLSQTDEGTGKVRELIWGGAFKMITDNPLRMIIGWGPEAMYVGYNKFYPPDLGHWELRNATPDRSHDVFFDQGVTLGLLGLSLYLLLVGTFVWYAVRALRKAPGLHDQLILIGFLSMVIAHIGELVTGIQIVTTYTYFYMGIAGTVVLAYVLTDYLRQPAPAAQAEAETGEANGAALLLPEPAPAGVTNGHTEKPAAAARRVPVTVAAGARVDGRVAPAAVGTRKGPGVPAATPPPAGARRAAGNGTTSSAGRLTPGSRPPGTPRVNVRPTVLVGSFAARQPGFLLVYALLGLVGLGLVIGLNVNMVKADMFYKQGLAYDSAQQWPGSIGPYNKAIAISPNEDFYYLFLGRTYMEWAKVQAQNAQAFPGSPPVDTLLADAEHSLNTAKGLNPLNTDHYANLGRLYVYWADAKGGSLQLYNRGIQMYETAHNLSPGNAEIWNELALSYAKAGRYDDAMAAIRGSQQMDNRYDQTPFLAAEIERSQAENYAAQTANPPAGVLSPTLVLSATQLARVAAQDYSTTVGLTPSLLQDTQFQTRLDFLKTYGVLGTLAQGYQNVIDQAQTAKRRDPASPDEPVAIDSALADIQAQLGNTAAAIKQDERAVQLQCDDFDSLRKLGALYQAGGDSERALNMLQAALAVADCNPADPYTNSCAPLKQSTQKRTCQPLTGRSDLAATINALRSQVQQLKQKLGRP